MSGGLLSVGLTGDADSWMSAQQPEATKAANLADALFLVRDPDGARFDQAAVNAVSIQSPADEAAVQELRRHMPVLLIGIGEPRLLALGDASVRADESEERLSAAMAEARMRWARSRRERLLAQIEAVGQLAGGTAHDFNNILTVVLGNLELIEISASDPKLLELAAAGITAAESGTRMTARLGNFSNRQGESQLHDLNSIVNRNVGTIGRHLENKYDVRASLQQGEIPITVDATRIEKILLNLGANAAEAMAPGGRMTLETSTQPLEIAGDHFHVLAEPIPDSYAVLTLRDAGEGMAPEVLRQAGELFFSTRDRSRGGGVGLSIALAYVQLEGGTMVLESVPGEGTAVHCLFPMPPSEHIVVEGVSAAAHSDHPVKVLLLDDDEMVEESTAQMLEQLGHTVVKAPKGVEALRMLNMEGDFGLVLSDIQMPGDINGVDLARMIGEAFPDLPVLLFTGSVSGAEVGYDKPVLKKPFTLDELHKAIDNAIPH